MRNEIERKWLVILNEGNFTTSIFSKRYTNIEQFYIRADKDYEIRLRKIEDVQKGGTECYATLKSGSGQNRKEIEEKIPEFLYDELKLNHNIGCIIRKRRYEAKLPDKHVAFIDRYESPQTPINNAIIEVEFRNKKEADMFDVTQFSRSGIVDNIDEKTDDPDYKNKAIAICGVFPP